MLKTLCSINGTPQTAPELKYNLALFEYRTASPRNPPSNQKEDLGEETAEKVDAKGKMARTGSPSLLAMLEVALHPPTLQSSPAQDLGDQK